MPTKLLDRWQPECIREFRGAAKERFNDGDALAASARGAGAIYVWGYSAEMILKAAYFSAIGFSQTASIDYGQHVLPGIQKGRAQYLIPWPVKGQGHNVDAWAQLLVAERSNSGQPYEQAFGLEIRRQGRRIGELWNEGLRYHKNRAYPYEVAQVRDASGWLLANARDL